MGHQASRERPTRQVDLSRWAFAGGLVMNPLKW